jgi:hypothetical protein
MARRVMSGCSSLHEFFLGMAGFGCQSIQLCLKLGRKMYFHITHGRDSGGLCQARLRGLEPPLPLPFPACRHWAYRMSLRSDAAPLHLNRGPLQRNTHGARCSGDGPPALANRCHGSSLANDGGSGTPNCRTAAIINVPAYALRRQLFWPAKRRKGAPPPCAPVEPGSGCNTPAGICSSRANALRGRRIRRGKHRR